MPVIKFYSWRNELLKHVLMHEIKKMKATLFVVIGYRLKWYGIIKKLLYGWYHARGGNGA
jgi:hypothetical protein